MDAIAKALAAQTASPIIEGHDLSEEDYAQLLRTLARHADAIFKRAMVKDEQNFQQAMIAEAGDNRALLNEVAGYLSGRFDLSLTLLYGIGDRIDAIKSDTAYLREQVSRPAQDPVQIPTEIPVSKAEQLAGRLVGRAAELNWLCERLRSQGIDAQAVLRGIGGMGKTELAIAAAKTLGAEFPGDVIWLECGAADVAAIQQTLAQHLGIALRGDNPESRHVELTGALQNRPRSLVVLDDVRARHLSAFAQLLPPCPPHSLLITTRSTMLPMHDDAIREIRGFEPELAQELLTALLPEGWISAEAAAAEACAGLLDIPLALRLAARRGEEIARRKDSSAQTPLSTLLNELRVRRLEVVDQSDDPNRPDLSLYVTFSLGLDDLEAYDRARLARLGVFAANDFRLPDVAAIWEMDEKGARRALRRLHNAGLVEETGEARWWMHELLREYAEELLERAGPDEAEAGRLAHAGHYQKLLEDNAGLTLEDRIAAAGWQGEIARACGWLTARWRAHPKEAAVLLVEMAGHFDAHEFEHWQRWLETGVGAALAAGERNAACRLQRHLGAFWQLKGEMERAESYYRASLAAAQQLAADAPDDVAREEAERGIAISYGCIADILQARGELEEALRTLQEDALPAFRRLGDVRSEAVCQGKIADILQARGELEEALRIRREVQLPVYRRLGDVRSEAVCQGQIADILQARGELEEALRIRREVALPVYERLGDVRSLLVGRANLAINLLGRGAPGDREEAVALLHLALDAARRLSIPEAGQIEAILAQVERSEEEGLTLDDLVGMIRRARRGDSAAGQQAWQVCSVMVMQPDDALAALGKALKRLLMGDAPEVALAPLPEELRGQVLRALGES